MSPPLVPVRPASSVVIVREGASGLEVLMVERPVGGFFGGLMVFPGGAVDDVDIRAGGSPEAGFQVAAVRETAEEVGILLTEDGFELSPELRGEALIEALGRDRLSAATARLTLVSRWVTPAFSPKRFDTRFYLVAIDGDPLVVLDREELIDYAWTSPTAALERLRAREWDMILPTVSHLRWLARWDTVAQVERAATGTDGMTIIEPIALEDGTLSPRYRGDQ